MWPVLLSLLCAYGHIRNELDGFAVLAWHISNTLKAYFYVEALNEATRPSGAPASNHTSGISMNSRMQCGRVGQKPCCANGLRHAR